MGTEARTSDYRGRVQRRAPAVVAWGIVLAVSGCLTATSAATRELPWIGVFSLVPVFRAIQVLRPAASSAACAVWGLSVAIALNVEAPGGLRGGLPLFALLTIAPGAYGAIGSLITRRVRFSPFVLGVGWMLLELMLRPIAVRHGLLASTQGDGVLVRRVGSVFGYVLVAFIVAFAGAWVTAILSMLRNPIAGCVIRIGSDFECAVLCRCDARCMTHRVARSGFPRAPPDGVSTVAPI